mgnify:CR=1 FL=1
MQGTIVKVSGPLIVASGMADVQMFDVVRVSDKHLIGEVIELREDKASIQVYEETAGLGDQLLTDAYAGKHIGLPALIVPPIKDKTNLFFRFKRVLERPFIRKYARLNGRQEWMTFWKVNK